MFVYGAGVPHPAWYILNSKFDKYKVANIDKILEGRKVKREEAKSIMREARDVVGKSKVEEAYNDSLLARSIFGAQFLLSIYLPFAKLSYGFGTCLAMWFVTLLFLFAWFHRNLLYYKSIVSKLVKDDEAMTKFKTNMSVLLSSMEESEDIRSDSEPDETESAKED